MPDGSTSTDRRINGPPAQQHRSHHTTSASTAAPHTAIRAEDDGWKKTNVRVEPPSFWAFLISIFVERLSHSSSTLARQPERFWNAVLSTTGLNETRGPSLPPPL